MNSFLQRLRSLRHRFWFGVSRRVRWSRGAFSETPAGDLPALAFEQAQRIAVLRSRYQVEFEHRMTSATSINNYEYLDILDRAWAEFKVARPQDCTLSDIGSASFWYAATLQAFFRPRELIGVEVEGYRLFKDGRSRIDYARGYLSDMGNARFVVEDYVKLDLPADVITAWFPFVTPAAILAWRLPLSLLTPQQLFRRIYHNLRPGGLLVMLNHGHEEASIAAGWCEATGLRCRGRLAEPGLLSAYRARPAVLSCWTASNPGP